MVVEDSYSSEEEVMSPPSRENSSSPKEKRKHSRPSGKPQRKPTYDWSIKMPKLNSGCVVSLDVTRRDQYMHAPSLEQAN